ncbi:MAG: DUF6036 family nucleotidyltransferase [Candidatus Nanopelagicales bacterium]
MFASREKVVAMLTQLGSRLDAQGIHGEIYIVGGTAMLLGYNRLTVTEDIDAVFSPVEEIEQIVADMHRADPSLPADWLNSKVLPLLPRIADSRSWEALEITGLSVSVASPEFLLAMKARASRGRRDFDDVAVLADVLKITDINQVWKICEEVWGFDVFTPESRELMVQYLATRGIQ